MRAVRITAIAVCLATACSEDPPPPDFTFVSYAHHPIGATSQTVTAVEGRLILDVGTDSSRRQFIATLTAQGVAAIDAALTEVENAWDGPYPCEECLYPDIYRFDEETSGPVMLWHFSGYALPVIQPLYTVVDELVLQMNGCAGGNGPWIERCFEPIGPDLHPDDWDQPLTPP